MKGLLKLKWFFKERLLQNMIAIVSNIISNIFIVVAPIVLGMATDDIANGSITASKLMHYVLVLVIIAISNHFILILWAILIFRNQVIIEARLQISILKKILFMPRTFFEKFKSGDLITRMSTNVESIGDFAGFGMMSFYDSMLYLPAVIVAMGIRVSWKLTLVCVIPLVLGTLFNYFLGKYVYKYYLLRSKVTGTMSDMVLEHVLGIRVIRAYSLEEQSTKDFYKKTEEVFDVSVDCEKVFNTFSPISHVFLAFSYAISMIYGAKLLGAGSITLGDMIAFNIFLSFLTWPMYAVGEFFNTAQRASASSDRVYEVLESEDDRKVENVKEKKVLFGDIEFSNYSFKYPSSEVINLSDINLRIKEGETLGIAGKTGSGKSTLIKQILAQYPVGEGKFTISGVPFLEVDKINLMNDVAYVSQENILFSRSIKENILFGSDEKVSDEELDSIIELADLKRDINIFTNGVDTQVGERGIAVSGGQKQRIAIARAIIKNAKLLILDDSLSAVDARTESKIIRNIKKNRENTTTIIISHRLSAISHADNIIVLDNGKIVEQGTHDELVSTDTWYLRQYNIQKLEEEEHE